MKRLILILAVLCLLLSLTACGGSGGSSDDPFPVSPDITKTPETKAPETQAPVTEPPATQAPVTEPPETQAPDTQAPETQAPDPVIALTKGVISGDVYTNESLKLRFELPEGWTFYSEEQIAQANNMSAELFENTDVQDAISAAGQYMDLFAVSATGTDNVNMVIQGANAVMNLMSDQQIFEAMEQTYRTQFASAGMEVNGFEIITAEFCGEEKSVLHLEMSMSGVAFHEYQVWVRNVPDYMAIMTVTSLTQETLDSVLPCFSRLD